MFITIALRDVGPFLVASSRITLGALSLPELLRLKCHALPDPRHGIGRRI